MTYLTGEVTVIHDASTVDFENFTYSAVYCSSVAGNPYTINGTAVTMAVGDTLEVVGLLWTGKYPKDRAIAREDFYTLPIEYLWGQLNYASPGYLIYEEISKL